MATRLYLRDLAWAGANNPPQVASTSPAPSLATGALIPRKMLGTPGSSQRAITKATDATTAQARIYATFVSDPLNNNESFTYSNSGTVGVSFADSETNLNVNHRINCCCLFVFRPSTNTVVGNLHYYDTWVSSLEPTSANSIQVSGRLGVTLRPGSGNESAIVSALAGDVLVAQIGAEFVQGMGTVYSASFYYDGSTVNTTENAVVSNHASYIEFSRDIAFAYIGAVAGGANCAANFAPVDLGESDAWRAGSYVSTSASADLDTTPRLSVGGFTSVMPAVAGEVMGDYTLPIGYGNGIVVYLNQVNGKAIRSSDLITWGGPSASIGGKAPDYIRDGTFGGGKFACSIGYNKVRSSVDGVTWETSFVSNPGSGSAAQPIEWNGEHFFLLVSGGGAVIQTSPDALTWTTQPVPPSLWPRAVGFGDGKWCGVDYPRVATWTPGDASWAEATLPFTSPDADWSSPTYFLGKFWSCDGPRLMFSTDGLTWELSGSWSPPGPPVGSRGGKVFVVGDTLAVVYEIATGGAPFYKSAISITEDGVTWLHADAPSLVARQAKDFMVFGSEIISVADTEIIRFAIAVADFSAPGGSAVVASAASADLTTARGTGLYTDAPMPCTASATATLTDGPTQWLGLVRARSSIGGSGQGIAALPAPDLTESLTFPQYVTVMPNGRWLTVRNEAVLYSDNEGFRWRQALGPTLNSWPTRYAESNDDAAEGCAFTLNAAGTRIVNGYYSIYSDDNGLTWQQGSGHPTQMCSSTVFGNGKFVRFIDQSEDFSPGDYLGYGQYSTNGAAWTTGALLTNADVPSIDGGMSFRAGRNIWYDATLAKFIAIGTIRIMRVSAATNGPAVAHSTDGIVWTVRSDLVDPPDGQYAMRNGVITTGRSYSTDGGLTWATAARAIPTTVGTQTTVVDSITATKNGFVALCGVRRPVGLSSETIYLTAFASTDGSNWEPTLIDGASAYYRTLGGPQASNDFGRNKYAVAHNAADSTTPIPVWAGADGHALRIGSAPSLTVSGAQPTPLFGAAIVRTDCDFSSNILGSQTSHSLAAIGLARATAPATDLIDALPFVVTIRTNANVSASLTTRTLFRGALRNRARSGGDGVVHQMGTEYTPGKMAYDPASGTVITPTRRRDGTTGQWGDLAKPDGANAPALVTHDGVGKFIAFMATGPRTYTSPNGISWTAGAVITPHPTVGWAGTTGLAITGGGGKAVLVGKAANILYSWVTTNGLDWIGPSAITTTVTNAWTLGGVFWTGDRFALFAHNSLFNSDERGVSFSADGLVWEARDVPIGTTGHATPVVSYSGGTMSVYQRVDAATDYDATVFIDLQALYEGRPSWVRYPDMGAGIPASYYIGDAHSLRPTFYRVSVEAFGRLTDPGDVLNLEYLPTFWAPPAGIQFTGDYSVFDGTLYGKATRTAGGATVGIYANTGPALYSSSISMGAALQAQATASAGLANTHALAGAVATASMASAVLTVRQNIVGAAAAQVSVSGLLQVPQLLVASTTSQAAASADLTATIHFAASVAASSAAAAAIATSIHLAAAVSVASTAVATTIQVPKPLVGVGQGVTTASATMQVPILMAASAHTQASPGASITTAILLAGDVRVQPTSDGDLTVGANFRSTGGALSVTMASLSTGLTLAASANAAPSLAVGVLITQIRLDSALTTECFVEADLDTSIDLQAAVQAAVQAVGVMRRLISADARANPAVHTGGAQAIAVRTSQQAAFCREAQTCATVRITDSAVLHTDQADVATSTADALAIYAGRTYPV